MHYFISKSQDITAVISLSMEDVSYIQESETAVEYGGVIWNTPIFAERSFPILLPVLFPIFSALFIASFVARESIPILRTAILV
jgi:hypothetical protein